MKWYVIYCKISENKKNKILQINYPFIGGIKDSEKEAESLAKKIIHDKKQFTIIPEIIQQNEDLSINDIIRKATIKFDKLKMQMQDNYKK